MGATEVHGALCVGGRHVVRLLYAEGGQYE